MEGVDPELLLGTIALDAKLITPQQLREALGDQARDLAQGKAPRQLGVILLAHGWITEEHLLGLLREQASRRERRRDKGLSPR